MKKIYALSLLATMLATGLNHCAEKEDPSLVTTLSQYEINCGEPCIMDVGRKYYLLLELPHGRYDGPLHFQTVLAGPAEEKPIYNVAVLKTTAHWSGHWLPTLGKEISLQDCRYVRFRRNSVTGLEYCDKTGQVPFGLVFDEQNNLLQPVIPTPEQ